MIRPSTFVASGICATAILFTTAHVASAAPTVRTASGADPASITPARDAYRADLGGGTTVGTNGSFGGVRREINWDGTPEPAQSAPNNLSPDFFKPRGVIFDTPGSGVQVSSNAAPQRFGNLNPTYEATFKTFSAQKLFTPIGSNVTDVKFVIPGSTTPASTNGFGSVFADVDAADTTEIQYYDENNKLVDKVAAPAADGGLSFVGASYNDGTRISRVRIVTGNTTVGPNDGGSANDVVVMDDFLYGEPLEIKPAQQQSTENNNAAQQSTVNAVETAVAPAVDTLAPKLKAAVRRTLKRAALRRGIKAKATTDEPSTLRFELRKGRTVLASKSLGVGTGQRSVTLKPRKRALRGTKRLKLSLRVTATDQSGNRTVQTSKISVAK